MPTQTLVKNLDWTQCIWELAWLGLSGLRSQNTLPDERFFVAYLGGFIAHSAAVVSQDKHEFPFLVCPPQS